uniref:Autophagy-related protein 9 n=1 Tax=Trypanosoma congolense (strain IL3000) TaxID=1068625 RepID=G0UZ89_TRYCI|nr:conserved hypothetical protein [Trypanosoma congolense IL3000]
MLLRYIPSFSLRYGGSGRIEDMHVFMKNLYRFWVYKGLWVSCLASLVDFLNSIVVFILVLFLTMIFDWSVAVSCDEVSCGSVSLTHGMRLPTEYGGWRFMLSLVLLISSAASVLYEFMKFLETCIMQLETERILHTVVDTGFATPIHRAMHVWRRMRSQLDGHEELHEDLLPFIGTMTWGNFLEEVCLRIQQDRSFGVVAYQEFDTLRAVQALMMYENYFITLHQHGVLDWGALKYVDDTVLKVLISSLFDEFNTIERAEGKVALLRWQVVKCLTLYTFLYPFVVVLFMLRLLVKNAAMMRTDWGGYMAKDWNRRAYWTFSLFNEVPHVLSARIAIGRQIAVEMVDRLKPYSNGKRFICRTASGVILVLIGLSIVNTSLLVSGTLCGIPLLWWLTVSLTIFSVCNETKPVQREYNYLHDLGRLIKQLHYSQKEWSYSGETFYNTIRWDFLKSRFTLIGGDLARTLFLPCILLSLLCDSSLQALVDCVQAESVRVDGLGSVAREAAFDSQRCDGGRDEDESNVFSGFSEKWAKSIASFSAIYPQWAAKHMHHGASADDVLKASAPHRTLDFFVTDLHNRVDEEVKKSQCAEISRAALDSTIPSEAQHNHNSSLTFNDTAHEREQLFVSQMMQSLHGTSHVDASFRTVRPSNLGVEMSAVDRERRV